MYKTDTINIYCRFILAPVKLTPSNSFSLELADMVSVSALRWNPEGYRKLAKAAWSFCWGRGVASHNFKALNATSNIIFAEIQYHYG